MIPNIPTQNHTQPTQLKATQAITIYPIKAFSDNYIWAIVNHELGQVIVIDPGQAQPVINFLEKEGVTLFGIWITHKHPDHIGGVQALMTKFPRAVLTANVNHNIYPEGLISSEVGEGSKFDLWNQPVEVLHVAGHTEYHLAYILSEFEQADSFNNSVIRKHVFCGDTLFSGGCGRVFTGDMTAMYESLQRLASLDETAINNDKSDKNTKHTDTTVLFYPAHEYTASNLRFGLAIEPNNQAMQAHLQVVNNLTAQGMPSLPSSLTLEKQINVFLRVQETSVIEGVSAQLQLAVNGSTKEVKSGEPVNIFTTLRKLKDNF